MTEILIAVAVVAGVGLVCGIVLAIASKVMEVKTDETVLKLRECLPGANCGACGYTGCDGYAEALATRKVKTNLCVPGADATAKKVAAVLGVEAEDVVEQVAFVHCNGTCDAAKKKFHYEGIKSCAAAKMLYNGDSACIYGCLGYGDCLDVCPEDAICLEDGIARVDVRKCIGCGMCTKTCPNHLFRLFPDVEKTVVMCSNKDKGAAVRRVCTNGCIACMKCEKSCPSGAIKVIDNLATIDYDKCNGCGICAEVCPVKCIKIADFSGKHRFASSREEQ